jgi:hypothetical protein
VDLPQPVPHIHSCPIIIITIIISVLGSTNEQEYVIFVLLNLAYLAHHSNLPFFLQMLYFVKNRDAYIKGNARARTWQLAKHFKH